MLAVTEPADAIALREDGCDAPILLFGGALADDVADAVAEYEFVPTISNLDEARAYADVPGAQSTRIALKVDTGAHRLGVTPERAGDLARNVSVLPGLKLDLVYTVFAAPATDPDFTLEQFTRFRTALADIYANVPSTPLASCATSAVISTRPEMYLDAVRCGNLIFGLYLPPDPPIELHLERAALALKTRVLHVQSVKAGDTLGWQRRVRADSPATYAVIPMGRVDGLVDGLVATGKVLVRGVPCPFIDGSLSGEHSCIDVTHLPDVAVGDEVVLFGAQRGVEIGLTEHAKWVGLGEAQTLIGYRNITHKYIGSSRSSARATTDAIGG
jgi:alanine racemase